MAVILADSDVLIDYLRDDPPISQSVRDAILARRLATSTINAYELTMGARSPKQTRAVEKLLDLIEVVPIDRRAAGIAGDLDRKLRANGVTVPFADFLIAGVCLAADLRLWTRNRSDFERIPGLKFFDP